MDAWYAISAGLWWPNGNWGSRGAPFGEDTLSPLRRYLKPLPKGGRGGGGYESIWIYLVCCDYVWTGMHAAFYSGICIQIAG